MPLTRTQCDRFKPKDKPYKKFDGEGLYLEIRPNGNKLWRLKYRFLDTEKRISFGKYPIVSLLEARRKKLNALELLDKGIDPSQNRINEEKLKRRNSRNNFEHIAREWFEKKSNDWSEGRANIVSNRLERNVFPYIGKTPITDLTPPDILDMLRIMENRNALEVAKRTRQICNQVFRYAIQTGRCHENPCIHLIGALKSHRKSHFASIEPSDLPQFIADLKRNDPRLYARTRRAIWLSLYTFCRPGEIRQARWEHIDLKAKQWTIPSHLMKMRRDHIIPLSDQALNVLLQQQEETGAYNTPWVFPGQVRPLKPMSDGTVNMAIKRLGYDGRMTAHGFRALARTTIREKLKYYPDIIEAQLAHKPIGSLGSAYDRAQFLDDRKQMMQDWADFIDGSLVYFNKSF